MLLFCHCLYFKSFYQICLPAWHGIAAFLWLGNSLWEQNGWGVHVWGLLSILETNRIASFIFQRIMPFFFQYELRNKFELRNMHFNTVYMVICVTGVCAWCRMRFCKLTEWLFCRSHPVLLTLTPSSTFGMWSVRKVRRRGPRNVRQLQQFVLDEWNRTAQCICLRYVASMHSQAGQAAIRANRGHTSIDR